MALGSRISLAGAVCALIVATSIPLLRGSLTSKAKAERLAYLGLPLILGVSLLGLFNYIRFGNFLEFGFRYQLGALDYTQSSTEPFALRYTLFNIYNYFARGVTFQPSFPFILPAGDNPTMYPLSFQRPALYYVEPITGFPLSAPFVLCLFGLCLSIRPQHKLSRNAENQRQGFLSGTPVESRFHFVWISLLVTALLSFAPLVVYWYCTERFLLDFLPLMLIVAVCGGWSACESARRWRRGEPVLLILIAAAAVWTVAFGLLLGVTGYGSHW